jgi:alpha-galactosidase
MRLFAYLLAFLALPLMAAAQQTPAAKPATAAPVAAQTPPMGWNSWNYFGSKVTDKDIRSAADQLVATGMKDAGYIYVNIDDTWEGDRDAQGVLHTNSKFPDMKALAEYVHSKGLKLGIYSTPGSRTCGGYAGSLDHEAQDAKMYAEWGIDYLKYDLCSFGGEVMGMQMGGPPAGDQPGGAPPSGGPPSGGQSGGAPPTGAQANAAAPSGAQAGGAPPPAMKVNANAPTDPAEQMHLMIAAYDKMGKALKQTGRPIVYSLCQYGMDAVGEWGPSVGANLWRTTGDVQANWQSIYGIISQQAGLASYAAPGHWNDPDMLEVGNGSLSLAENRSHFSMWAMLAAPLLAGNDLPNMKPEIKAILTNKSVIAIDQDSLGKQATRAYADGEVEVWSRPLAGGDMAVAVLNVGSDRVASHPFHLNLAKLGLHGAQKAHDLWKDKDLTLTENQAIELPSHDILLVRIAAAK